MISNEGSKRSLAAVIVICAASLSLCTYQAKSALFPQTSTVKTRELLAAAENRAHRRFGELTLQAKQIAKSYDGNASDFSDTDYREFLKQTGHTANPTFTTANMYVPRPNGLSWQWTGPIQQYNNRVHSLLINQGPLEYRIGLPELQQYVQNNSK